MSVKVLIRNARAAFVELGEADYFQGRKQRDNDKKRRSITFICTSETQAKLEGDGSWAPAKQVIDRAIQMVATDRWGQKASAYLAAILPDPKGCCFQDGNRKPDCEGFPGNWALAAHRTEEKGRPLVVDTDRTHLFGHEGVDGKWVLTDTPVPGKEGRIYSGAYVNGSVDLWAQDNNAGKGIRGDLLGVQFVRDGDAFGGGGRRADPSDFDALAEGATADDLV